MQSSYLLLNGLRVHYLHWGAPDGGRAIVLLHGLASNARIWELTAPYLVQHGLRLLAPDARNHGLTDQPDGDHGFETYGRDLAAFIEACGLERPLLVGHSWGANLALDYASRMSLGRLSPAGLVLVDGGLSQLNDGTTTWEETRRRLTPPPLKGMALESFLQRLHRPQRGWQLDEHCVDIILANFEIHQDLDGEVETIAPRLALEYHMEIVRALWEFDPRAAFSRVRCPILAVPARQAPLNPDEEIYLRRKENGATQAGALARDFRLHWMDDTVHDIPLQRPERLAEHIVEFYASLG